MLKSDFEAFKIHQYCDNPLCGSYGLVGAGNLITHSIILIATLLICIKKK
jgi:hypothetical protein